MSPSRHRVARTAHTWVEVECAALNANLHAFRQRLGPSVELAHVVKSNAYGHGLELIAKEDEASGIVQSLAVISVEELVRVREARVRLPVIVLGYVPLRAFDTLVEAEGSPVIFNSEALDGLSKAASDWGREVKVHLKVETGTNRYGIPIERIVEAGEKVKSLPGLALGGVTTHFANIEDTTDHSYAMKQLERFRQALKSLEDAGFLAPVTHTACSAAAILFPESHFDMARIGIASYGLWPSKETRVSAGHIQGADLELKPVLAWKTRVAQVKNVAKGEFVGYGCTWRAPVDSKLAILPMGYADGYDRGLSNVGHVLINGHRAPIRGRVCMNVTIVDVTHIEGVVLEDEVVLIGNQGNESITADEVAGWAGTISYEVVSRISEHLPRVRVQY